MIKVGTVVQWKWGSGTAKGKVNEVFTEDITKFIKGSEITRKATPENKAYYIAQEDGDKVLKSATEIERAD
ncbi:DUF2945 domain-containing protein [Kaistella antarctica]|uniref:Hypervirulence associated protein TUDOR domain-containing protein n=1 Tax=Kaistella antarctica TaxID=266748 RepID=A0A3S4WPC8_9FLAO|nr:DUF2945 domain-containing protein [Kaistella antarctica]KEY19835.1 hypothetical protein HY04_00990 [Kaistella antarctica]SEV97068.1 hypothetical protein SAMN05421765_1577 [Kaistella antarctica]VEH96358.1 Uncharacterised protein [Kaistella antarctica]